LQPAIGNKGWRWQSDFVVPLVATAAALLASLLNFLNHNQYPLLTPEVALVAAGLVAAATGIAIVYAVAPPIVRVVLDVVVIYLALDLNFDGLIAGLAAAVIAVVLNRRLMPVLAVVFPVILITQLAGLTLPKGEVEATGPSPAAGSPAIPAVLHVILDEHVGIEGLPEGFPEAAEMRRRLSDFYGRNGFRLYGGAFSEHFRTVNAIPQILNFGADAPQRPQNKAGIAMERNAYFDQLGKTGYRIRVYQSDFVDYCAHSTVVACVRYSSKSIAALHRADLAVGDKASTIVAGYWSLSDVAKVIGRLYDASVQNLNGILPVLDMEQSALVSTVNALHTAERLVADLGKARPGDAFFAHLLLPHYPYATNRDCSLKPKHSWLMRRSLDASWRERQLGYFDQLGCVEHLIGRALAALSSSPAGQHSIVVLHGDHGSRITRWDPTMSYLGRFAPRDVIDGHSTLFAARAPQLEPGYDARHIPVWRLLSDLARSGFRAAPSDGPALGAPGIMLENSDWQPVRRHDLPADWSIMPVDEAAPFGG
jgi:hypothetical protein